MNLLQKRKIPRKITVSSFLFYLLLIYTIGSSTFILSLAFARFYYQKNYVVQIGASLTGVTDVYSKRGENIYLLNQRNSNALAKLSTTGAIFFKDPTDKLTGRSFEIIAINEDNEYYYLTYEETDDARCRVTIEGEDEKRTVTLRDIKYSTLARLASEHSSNGDNEIVYNIP